MSCANGKVSDYEYTTFPYSSATIVLCSEGYPSNTITGRVITGTETKIEEGEISAFVHYAGTMISNEGKLISNGGRVLAATGIAPDLGVAVEAAYEVISNIKLEGSYFRKDIAHKGL